MPHRSRPRRVLALALLALAFLALVLGLATTTGADGGDPRPPAGAKPPMEQPKPAQPAPAKDGEAKDGEAKADPLLIGTFPVTAESIIDGDTIRLPDGKPSIRLLGLDTEETFKNEATRKAAAADFAAYAKAQRGDSLRPVKYGTPAGEAARDYLKALAKGCTTMRLERERPNGRDRGTYGRLLAYVFLIKGDASINVTEALIRTGHSPYFVKYGRSARFDKLFTAAQDEAREAGRGIWSKTGPAHYPDYDERLPWWNERAAQLERWSKLAAGADHVTLGEPTTDAKLKTLVGKEATVFGLLDRELPVKGGDKRIFLLSHMRRRGFALVVFDTALAKSLDEQERFHSMYVTVRAKVTLYKGRAQMVLEKSTQVSTK